MKNKKITLGLLRTQILGIGLVLLLGLSGCSTTPTDMSLDGDVTIQDPFEDTNRAIFAFNNVVDDALIHPIAKGYNAVLPQPVRTGIRNVLRNLKSPITLANQALQGDTEGSVNVLKRTTINTLAGFGGLIDIAGESGIPYEPEDFGQTLAVWGVDNGPYFVVPILGSSTLRDSTGIIVDGLANPLRLYLFNIDEEYIYYSMMGLEYLNLRADLVDVLEDLERSSIDYYASVRSTYYQNRAALVKDQDPDTVLSTDIPDYDDF